MVTAGEAMDEELASWLERELASRGVELLDGWGETELGGIVAFDNPAGSELRVPDCVGWPGASQPPAPSDPGVTVSRHRALLTGPSVRADPRPVGE
jgi:acyl-coenzyme A synthetase/AMP-(fatty) acid ligase